MQVEIQKEIDLSALRQPRLGRFYTPDTRDHNYPLRSVLPRSVDRNTVPRRHFKYWSSKVNLNQGNTPQCVIYSGLHLLHDGPVMCYGPEPLYDPKSAYCWAQSHDEWDGDCGRYRYDGTSVRAGLEYMLKEKKLISEYRWALDPVDAVLSLFTLSPLQMGTWWRRDMWDTDEKGYVHYSGSYNGGHAWLANGVRIPKNMSVWDAVRLRLGDVRCKNSWGTHWGVKGHFWMSMGDFIDSFEDYGEAAIIREVDRTL